MGKSDYHYPKAVVFDLDYTLWPCWCDVHIELPIKNSRPDQIVDSYGYKLSLYKDVPGIIQELADNGVAIISASRTPTQHIAKQMISHIRIGSKPMKDYFASSQWGTTTKTRHINRAAQELGLESELKNGEFILFDDEYRNKDVNSIGCEFVYIRDTDKGLTRSIFEQGLKEWSAKHK